MTLEAYEAPVVRTADLEETASRATEVATALDAAVQRVRRELRDLRLIPRGFVGFIRDYRFTVGKVGDMPSHRFYLECDGGLWLFSCVPPSVFEGMMKEMDDGGSAGAEAITALSGDTLNGRMLFVRPDSDLNAIVPVRFVEDLGVIDRYGKRLFIGAPVLVEMPDGSRLRAEVASDQEGRGGSEVRVSFEQLDEGTLGDGYVSLSAVERNF